MAKKPLNQGQQWMAPIQAGVEQSNGDRPKGMPTLAMIKQETARFGLPDSDAEAIYDVWLSNGFTLKGGAKIKDFKATMRTWHRNHWFDSQRRAAKRIRPEDDQKAQLEKFRRAKHG
jgi:hypothetical protein